MVTGGPAITGSTGCEHRTDVVAAQAAITGPAVRSPAILAAAFRNMDASITRKTATLWRSTKMAPTSRIAEALLGKIPTTRDRRLSLC